MMPKVTVIEAVTAHIFQPRVDEAVKPVVFSLNELIEKYLPTFLQAVDISESLIIEIQDAEERGEAFDKKKIEPYQKVGKWCQFCRGKPLCQSYIDSRGTPKALEAFQKALAGGEIKRGENTAKKVFSKGIIDAETFAFLAVNAGKIKSFLDDFPEAAVELLTAGEKIPGIELDKTEGRRSWIDDEAQIEAELKELGIESPFEVVKKFKTITDVEKEIGKGKIDALTQKSEGGLKVVEAGKAKNTVAVGAGTALLFKEYFDKR